MSETRHHPDIFTPAAAAEYLYLDSERTLETLERDYGLVAIKGVNKTRMFWRGDLDAAALRWFGRDKTVRPGMRMAR